MRLLTEFSLEKVVSWSGIVAVAMQESGWNVDILWKQNQEDLDEWQIGDEIIKDDSGGRIEGPYTKMQICQFLENV